MLRLRSTLPVIAAALAATAIAACGSSSPGTTSASSSSGPSQAQIQHFQSDAVKFTSCMRTHGVANFPDAPTQSNPSSGRIWKNAFQNKSPAFHSAAAACQHFLPRHASQQENSAPSHTQVAAMLAFARCIRSHGFTGFPDPTSSGITHEMIATAGIDLHQPALVQAADACVSVTHGYITKAVVTRFIAGH
jgi:hypothetical protein